MKGIVVYGSNYGTTRTYAQELARRTGWPAVDWQQAKKLADYEAVVYLGGMPAAWWGSKRCCPNWNRPRRRSWWLSQWG